MVWKCSMSEFERSVIKLYFGHFGCKAPCSQVMSILGQCSYCFEKIMVTDPVKGIYPEAQTKQILAQILVLEGTYSCQASGIFFWGSQIKLVTAHQTVGSTIY